MCEERIERPAPRPRGAAERREPELALHRVQYAVVVDRTGAADAAPRPGAGHDRRDPPPVRVRAAARVRAALVPGQDEEALRAQLAQQLGDEAREEAVAGG